MSGPEPPQLYEDADERLALWVGLALVIFVGLAVAALTR